jgi:hypothetical protein
MNSMLQNFFWKCRVYLCFYHWMVVHLYLLTWIGVNRGELDHLLVFLQMAREKLSPQAFLNSILYGWRMKTLSS